MISTTIIALTVSLFIVCALIVAGNGFLCAFILCKKPLRTYTNGFLVSLAVSNLLTGGVNIPFKVMISSSSPANFLAVFTLLSGVFNLMGVTFDLFVAVTKPLQYKVTIAKYFAPIITASWIMPMLIGLLPVIGIERGAFLIPKIFASVFVGIFITTPLVVIILAYCAIFKTLKQNSKRISDMANTSSLARVQARRVLSERKLAKLFSVVVTLYLVSWLPVIFISAAHILGRKDLVHTLVTTVSKFTTAVSSLVNSLLYTFMKHDIRVELKTLFVCTKGRVRGIRTEPHRGKSRSVETQT